MINNKGKKMKKLILLLTIFMLGCTSTSQEVIDNNGKLLTQAKQNVINKPIEATEKEAIEALTTSEKFVLVYMYATWCPYCVKMLPIIEKFAKNNPDITVLKVDIVKNKINLRQLGGVPKAYFGKKGYVYGVVNGYVDLKKLQESIDIFKKHKIQ